MRVPLAIAVSVGLLTSGLHAGADCEGLELPPPALSFKGDEAHLFRQLTEIIHTESDFRIDAPAVTAQFLTCLTELRNLDDRPTEFDWVEQLAMHDASIEFDGTTIVLERKRTIPIWKTARATTRDLLRLAAPDDPLTRQLLWHAWVEALIESLGNRHNHYVYADELDADEGISRGRVFRIGVRVQRRDKRLVVVEVLDDSLRSQGVVEGAVLAELDGVLVDDHGYRDLVRFWYSLDPFEYRALLDSDDGHVQIEAAAVPYRISTVASSRLDAIGYLRIRRFAEETLIELRRALRGLHDTEALIVDLRGNSGGRLSVELIDMFFKPDRKLVSYRKVGSEEEPSHRTGSVEYHGQRLVVLIDRDTASMSELFAAAVRQHERGILLGETTSGKGVSQTLFPVGEEGQVALVRTAFFYPGTVDSWHEIGIDPHRVVELSDEQRETIDEMIAAPLLDLGGQLEMDPVLRTAVHMLEDSP